MSVEMELKKCIQKALNQLGIILPFEQIIIERSKEKIHGDYATNIAMQMARTLRQNPLSIAEQIVSQIDQSLFEKIEVVRPGFINFFMKAESLSDVVNIILQDGEHYGDSDYGKHEKINVEFVSANPTGDLHLGHARGAAIGDTICRLYQKVGYDVTREYYVNDAGNQITVLGKSIRARYHQLFGDMIDVPDDGYHGEDLIEIAAAMKEEVQDRYLVDSLESENYFKRRGAELELQKLDRDLKNFRVTFDRYSYETSIREAGGAERVLEATKDKCYLEDGALFLKTTDYGDDKDRVLVKSDGSYTYLLPDIAYHLDKLSRGYHKLIDVLGADHHGYINRMKAALMMFGYDREVLDIELIQMVRLFKNGAEYKMSKRTGNAISMRELCDEVGIDAVRYFFISRAASAHLDFDLDLALEKSSANPVYYAQYAYARLRKVLNLARDIEIKLNGKCLTHVKEMDLMKHLSDYPKEVLDAAITRSPYKMTNYIQRLAVLIHGFYTECRLIDYNNLEITSSRLALAKAAMIVMHNALSLIGVEAPEEM